MKMLEEEKLTVSGQLHVPAVLPPGKEPHIWTPDSECDGEDSNLCACRDWNPGLPDNNYTAHVLRESWTDPGHGVHGAWPPSWLDDLRLIAVLEAVQTTVYNGDNTLPPNRRQEICKHGVML